MQEEFERAARECEAEAERLVIPIPRHDLTARLRNAKAAAELLNAALILRHRAAKLR